MGRKKQQEYNKCKKLSSTNEELENLTKEYAWANVESMKNEVKNLNAETLKKKKQIAAPEGKLTKLHIEKSREEMVQDQAEYLQKQDEIASLKTDLQKQKQDAKKLNMSIKTIDKKTKQIKLEIEMAENKIKSSEMKISHIKTARQRRER